MIRTEFGIIDVIDPQKNYLDYTPEKYHCIAIDEDIYMNDWWSSLTTMKTYFQCLDRPEKAFDRWGITLIPPESLFTFKDIVFNDKRFYLDKSLVELANLIQKSIDENKYMIHYGV